jgi:hypothetical protein
MKLTIDSNQRNFFYKNKLIEFEGLISPKKTAELLQHVESAVQLKIQNSRIPIRTIVPEQFFDSGRDLWRVDEFIKKLESNAQITEVVSELVEQRSIRLGYDQYFPVIQSPKMPSREVHSYHRFLQRKATLAEISCLDGLLGAFMICLKGDGAPHEASIFSSTPGHAVFFSPDFLISFEELYQRVDHKFLMIVYTTSKAAYLFDETAPHCHEFKHVGYGFGDKLIDKWNPIVCR